MATPMLVELSEREQETLESWLVTFDQTWHDEALAVWAADRLPAAGSRLRQAALAELVKIDLEHQWQSGRRTTLEWYLDRYPELGPAESVRADLLLAEYRVRRQFGAAAAVAEFARRFPARAAELERLIAEQASTENLIPCSSPQPPMSAAERDTSHATCGAETIASDGQARELTGDFGRYRILRKLGQGGMGAVYLAHDSELDRQVALKVPHFSAQDGPHVLQRFLREARAAATLQHPNLCPIYDVGEIGGVHYLTMAYIEGHLVSEYIRPGKRQPERQTAGLIRKLALALQEAHAHGVVHRDLKPTNVFVNRRGEPVIMDFGLARRTTGQEAAITQKGALLGTPAYMAPEQARGKGDSIGPACDIYSLGVILYELLTGQRPFRGELLEVLSQVLTAEPEPPSKHRPDLDRRLEAICLKAMAKRPEDRYATMADFAAALTEFLKARQAFQPDQTSPELDQPGSSQPGKADVQADESYGLTEAAAGLSQLLPKSTPGPVRGGAPDSNEVHGGRDSAGSAKPGMSPTSASRARRLRPSPPAVLTRLSKRQKVGSMIAVGVVFALVLLGIVVVLRTPDGTLVVELDDSEAVVQVLNEEGKLLIQRRAEPGQLVISVDPGKRRLRVEKDGLELFAKDFTIGAGGRETIRARLEAATPEKPLPQSPQSKEEPKPFEPPAGSPSGPVPPPAIAPFNAAKAKEHQAAWAKYLGVPVEFENSIGMRLVLIPPGEFEMGSTEAEVGQRLEPARAQESPEWYVQHLPAETPRHRVRITKPFYLGVFEVTQAQYELAVGSNPSQFQGDPNRPVEKVDWFEAAAFGQKLSELPAERTAGSVYRLPTEAEWEYACRAGTTTNWYPGENEDVLKEYGWYNDNTGNKTEPVGQKLPNAWGLCDLHGNVWEWCQDWLSSYAASPVQDPAGAATGTERICRGGSWRLGADLCRVSYRNWNEPGYRSNFLGFRVVRSVP